MLKKLMKTDNALTPLILRLTLGGVMFPHGAQKMLGWFGGYGFSATYGYFTHAGMPAALALALIIGEFCASLGLIFGFLTRIAAAGELIIMTCAILMVHYQNGFFMNWMGNQKGEGFEYHLLAIGIALAVILKGGGALSLDRFVCGGKKKK